LLTLSWFGISAQAGYTKRATGFYGGAGKQTRGVRPDLILLDLNLPPKD